jgi:hypothetical protein
MATLEELTVEAQAEIDAIKTVNGGSGMFKQVNKERMEFNEADYDQKVIDLANSRWQEQQFGYIQARQEAYGSYGQQLDMIYWDKKNGTSTWEEHIDQVKADNPKPA